eukprot:6759149-Pyramimonas_sp.AAC.1
MAVVCVAAQYSTVQNSTAQYSTVNKCGPVWRWFAWPHSTAQYSTVQNSTEQYSTVNKRGP